MILATITTKPGVTLRDVAQFLNQECPCTYQVAVSTARNMLLGCAWHPEVASIDVYAFEQSGLFDVVVPDDDGELSEENSAYIQAEILRARGAEGDIEAAVEFCKLDHATIYSLTAFA